MQPKSLGHPCYPRDFHELRVISNGDPAVSSRLEPAESPFAPRKDASSDASLPIEWTPGPSRLGMVGTAESQPISSGPAIIPPQTGHAGSWESLPAAGIVSVPSPVLGTLRVPSASSSAFVSASSSIGPGASSGLAATLPVSLETMARPDLKAQMLRGELPVLFKSVSSALESRLQAAAGVPANVAVVSYQWNARGQITHIVQADPDGPGPQTAPETSYAYDSSGRLSGMTLPDSSTRLWTYDAAGRVTSYTDEIGRQTLTSYDSTTGLALSVRQVVGEVDSTANSETDDILTAYTYTTSSADPAAAPAGLVATVTDPLGHVTAYDYNSRGSVTRVTYALGTADEAFVQFAYDSANRLTSQTDELGRRTQFTYDALSRVIARTDPDPDAAGPQSAPVTRYEYTPLGQLLRETDPLGRVTEYVYQNGQLADIHGPLAPAVRSTTSSLLTTQDALGRVTSQTDAMGNVTAFAYSDSGRTITITGPDPDGTGPLVSPVVVYQHDSAGNVVSITDATGGITTFGYDDLGRKITETGPDPDGTGPLPAPVTHYAYDKANNLLSVTDSLGHTTEYAYDARDRRIAILDAEGGLTEFAYDDVGNLTALTDPVGNTTTWVYDNLNRVISETNELGYTRYFTYDLAGRQIEKIDRNGRVTQYGYDSSDHLTSEIWYSNTTDAAAHQDATNEVYWQYDSAGRLLSESDNYSSSTYTYDDQNRRISETISNRNSEIVVLTAGYSRADDLRTSFSVTVGGVADLQQTFAYTSTGLLTHIAQTGQTGGNAVASIGIDLAYDSLGRLVHLDRFQGTSFVAGSTWQYDSQNRLVALTHAQGQTNLTGYTWSCDIASRLTDATSPDGPVHYSYDDTDQLAAADYENTQQFDESYQWDANGNRSDSGWVTGANNQLLSDGTFWYSYDAEGNRTARFIWTDTDADSLIDDGERSQITEYSWDNRNRLTRVSERATDNGLLTHAIDYLYDTQNRWIGEIADSDGNGVVDCQIRFTYDGNLISLQFDKAGTGIVNAADLSHRYLWQSQAVDIILADETVTSTSAPGVVTYPLTDQLGTVRDLATLNAQSGVTSVANHIRYDSFGKVVGESDARISTLVGYTGLPQSKATGLVMTATRPYDPSAMRFAAEDWIGYDGGVTNTSEYVSNGPVNGRDPKGTETWLFPWEDDADLNPLHAIPFWFSHTPAEHMRGFYTTDTDETPFTQSAMEAAGRSVNEKVEAAQAFFNKLSKEIHAAGKELADAFVATIKEAFRMTTQAVNDTLKKAATDLQGSYKDQSRFKVKIGTMGEIAYGTQTQGLLEATKFVGSAGVFGSGRLKFPRSSLLGEANPILGLSVNLSAQGTWNFTGTFEGDAFVTITPNFALRWQFDAGLATAFVELGISGSCKKTVDDILAGRFSKKDISASLYARYAVDCPTGTQTV